MKRIILSIAAAVAALASARAGDVVEVGPYAIKTFDPALYSQEPTECDRLAGHRDDPHKVAPGKSRAEIDLPTAVTACKAAVEADPTNPRLNYIAGRVLAYSGRGDEAMPYRKAAVEGGYPQSLFVTGYIYVLGLNIEKDVCLGAELMRLSALAGRFAGQTGFPYYVTSGQFQDCPVRMDKVEMLDMLNAAAPSARNFYEEILVDTLRARVNDL
ncbi:MAG: hypothetical protein AAGC95_11710 [Pseudomonadota bacterium]